MSDFLATTGCFCSFLACFLVLKNTRWKKTFRIYPHGGKLTMKQGVFYDVNFGFSGHRIPMQFTGAQFRVDHEGIDAMVKFDSRPKQFISFVEGK